MVVAGGNTMYHGIDSRLIRELESPSRMLEARYGPRPIAPPERLFSTWIGGSILVSLNSFPPCWVSKAVCFFFTLRQSINQS
jgi:actin-related protein